MNCNNLINVLLLSVIFLFITINCFCADKDPFLDKVILFDQPNGSSNDGGPPENALGPNNSTSVSIDIPETLILAFTDNSALDGDGDDIYIYEMYNLEKVDVYASADNMQYYKLGTANGNVGFDISRHKLTYVNYIKLVGLDDGGSAAGFDLDAIKALHSGDHIDDQNCPEITDSDNDGVIDKWDSCPKTPENSCVNNKGCSCELLVIDEKGSVENGKWKTYYANIKNAYSNFIVKIQNLTEDVDLYVRKGSKPDFNNYECRPYKGGKRDEICDLSNNGDNLWYFSIYGYKSGDFSISVKAKR